MLFLQTQEQGWVKVISQHRGNALIVAEMTPGTELPVLSDKPELDLAFNWAAMGKSSSLGLGLALARPDRVEQFRAALERS